MDRLTHSFTTSHHSCTRESSLGMTSTHQTILGTTFTQVLRESRELTGILVPINKPC